MDVFLFSALKPCEEQVADLYLSGLRASVAKNDVEFVIRAHIPVKGQLGCQGFQISLDRFGGRACRPGGTIETGTHRAANARSEEHTSELQSLMRISYAVFCL